MNSKIQTITRKEAKIPIEAGFEYCLEFQQYENVQGESEKVDRVNPMVGRNRCTFSFKFIGKSKL